MAPLRDQHRAGAVLQHPGDPVVRIARIDGDEAAAGLQDAEHAGQDLRIGIGEQGDP
jgi:hypothetical protein